MKKILVTVTLEGDVVAALQTLAAATGTSATEQLRQGISARYDLRGKRVFVQYPGQWEREVTFPWG